MTLCFHLSRIALPALVLSMSAAASPQDPFEPNDSCGAAAAVALGTTSALTLGPDDDFFRFAVPASADVRVEARDAALTALDIELYDSGTCALIASAVGAPLRYFACGAPAGSLIVRVPGGAFADLPYELTISAPSIVDTIGAQNGTCATALPIGSFSTPGLVVTECNEDHWFYRVRPNDYAIQIDVASSTSSDDIDLELRDDACNTLLGVSASTGNTEHVSYTNMTASPQVIRARVSMKNGGHATYMLTVCFTGPTFPPFIGRQACESVPNSTTKPGTLCAIGSDVALDNDVRLAVFDLPMNSFGYFITSQAPGFVMSPGNTMGNLCLNGPGRYSYHIQTTANTSSVFYSPNLTMTPLPGGGFTQVIGGQRWYWQYWYRDSIMGMSTSNFSSAVFVDFM